MLRFFRNIRLQLVESKKLRRYLLYALGEIALVVIGILIALAINNASAKNSLKKTENTYLSGLETEFKMSKNKLRELIGVNRENMKGAREILNYTNNRNNKPSETRFSELLYTTFAYDISFNANNSLLNEMVSSGSLKDLSNPELRIRLTNWFATLEDIAKQERDLALQRENVLDMFRDDNSSIRQIFDDTGISEQLQLSPSNSVRTNLAMLESPAFENNVLYFLLTSFATETYHYQPLLQEIEAILALIGKQIESGS
ncbi:DUF6090 family protein [Robertkochia aurantiaca]|uniref:DUF6090 family protein n=1 Tax=Robertkochia aurantiaca TaxID=2873700 RepID=UPI001CCF033A|nr:DUF6090 family protein [Robertkochia sp. 3YJGBD-33]